MYEVWIHRGEAHVELDLRGYGDENGRYLSAGHAHERAKELAARGLVAVVSIDRLAGGPREEVARYNPKP